MIAEYRPVHKSAELFSLCLNQLVMTLNHHQLALPRKTLAMVNEALTASCDELATPSAANTARKAVNAKPTASGSMSVVNPVIIHYA